MLLLVGVFLSPLDREVPMAAKNVILDIFVWSIFGCLDLDCREI